MNNFEKFSHRRSHPEKARTFDSSKSRNKISRRIKECGGVQGYLDAVEAEKLEKMEKAMSRR